MARRKRKTAKAVARDNVTLDSVFTGIANAIRAKAETSDPISPRNMGNAIRELRRVAEASIPESSLPAVFQDIADAIRACGITGTMTATQMSEKIGDIVPYQKTKVTYTQASGLPDWEGVITGQIAGTSSSPTTQIPNVTHAQTIRIGDDVTSIWTWAFLSCSSLTSLSIPDSVTSIGYCAFYGCSGLTGMEIPGGVTIIWAFAFSGCTNLAIFDFRKSTSVPTLNNVNAFTNTPQTKEIVVPDALYDDWIVANNWSSSTNNIVNCIVKASQSSLGPLTT